MILVSIEPKLINVKVRAEIKIIFQNLKNEPYSEIYFAFKHPPKELLVFGDRPIRIGLLEELAQYTHKMHVFAEKPGKYLLSSRRFNYKDYEGKIIHSKCEIALEAAKEIELKSSQTKKTGELSNPVPMIDIKDRKSNKKRSELKNNLQTFFNVSDLKDLCFDMEIDYENFSHSRKNDFIRELVEYCENYGFLSTLYSKCMVIRPNLDWQYKGDIS